MVRAGRPRVRRATRTVTSHVLKITTVISWMLPAAIAYLTPLVDSHLNATADLPGTMTYTPEGFG